MLKIKLLYVGKHDEFAEHDSQIQLRVHIK